VALTLDVPSDLCVPEAGSSTARVVLSGAVRRALQELPALLRAHAFGKIRTDVLSVERVVRALLRANVGPLASVVRRPHTSTLARVLRVTPPGQALELTSELCALLCFDLSWLDALPHAVTLHRLPPRFLSLVGRVEVTVPGSVRAARFSNGSVVFEADGGASRLDLQALARGEEHAWVRRPYRVVEGDCVLALSDNSPLSHIEAHPDKTAGNGVDLGARPEQEWVRTLREALAIIEVGLPPTRADVDLLLSQVIPVGYDSEKHLSCSYREAIGTIYVTLHPDLMTMAEAVIHEVSHNKLNALFETDPVIENPPDELHPSPLRPDPRPLHGVLLAVHAFLPVARLYERLHETGHPIAQSSHFRQRFREIVRKNEAGARVLFDRAHPTRVGGGLLDEIARWDRHFAASRLRQAS
jgi:HEXXH motif-containing protein